MTHLGVLALTNNTPIKDHAYHLLDIISRDDETPPGEDTITFDMIAQVIVPMNTEKSSWPVNEMNMVLTSFLEAIEFLYLAYVEVLKEDPTNPSQSFLRYFRSEDFSSVSPLTNALLYQAGLVAPGSQASCAPAPNQLPLKIYYKHGPEDTETYNVCTLSPNQRALMSRNPYDGMSVSESQHMVICDDFFHPKTFLGEGIHFRTLGPMQCSGLNKFASYYSGDPGNTGDGGMYSSGATLLHELLHWDVLIPWISHQLGGGLIDPKFTSSDGRELSVYGPWRAQTFRKLRPDLATTAVENHIWYLLEVFWRMRCKIQVPWEDSPQDEFPQDPFR